MRWPSRFTKALRNKKRFVLVAVGLVMFACLALSCRSRPAGAGPLAVMDHLEENHREMTWHETLLRLKTAGFEHTGSEAGALYRLVLESTSPRSSLFETTPVSGEYFESFVFRRHAHWWDLYAEFHVVTIRRVKNKVLDIDTR